MSRAFSLAGFEVTLIGRFWVTTEGIIRSYGAGDGESNRAPIEFAMISADFIDSRNSPSSHGKWLRSLQRWTAAFCRLNNASSCSQARLLLACEMHTPRSRLMLTTTKKIGRASCREREQKEIVEGE